jgi:hypothetical protein
MITRILAVAVTVILANGCAQRDHGSTSYNSQSTTTSSGYSK